MLKLKDLVVGSGHSTLPQGTENRPPPLSEAAQPIQTHGLLESTPLRPLTQEQRERVKDKMRANDQKLGYNTQKKPFLVLDIEQEALVPAVRCNLALSAMEHQGTMPQQIINDQLALWDTGVQSVVITDDLLSAEFLHFLNHDEVHDPYRTHEGDSRVQLSCVMEFSNHQAIQLETYATVVATSSAPNGRSGIILGQLGLINAVRYESIPRDVVEHEGTELPDGCWGKFDIKSYVDVDGELHLV